MRHQEKIYEDPPHEEADPNRLEIEAIDINNQENFPGIEEFQKTSAGLTGEPTEY